MPFKRVVKIEVSFGSKSDVPEIGSLSAAVNVALNVFVESLSASGKSSGVNSLSLLSWQEGNEQVVDVEVKWEVEPPYPDEIEVVASDVPTANTCEDCDGQCDHCDCGHGEDDTHKSG